MIHERLRSQERKSVGRTPDGSEARQGFTPKGVRATDCSRENNLPWIASQEIVRLKGANSTSVPEGSEPLGSASEGAQFEDCSRENNLPRIASQEIVRLKGANSQGFTPKGVRATDCSLENNLPWIASQEIVLPKGTYQPKKQFADERIVTFRIRLAQQIANSIR